MSRNISEFEKPDIDSCKEEIDSIKNGADSNKEEIDSIKDGTALDKDGADSSKDGTDSNNASITTRAANSEKTKTQVYLDDDSLFHYDCSMLLNSQSTQTDL